MIYICMIYSLIFLIISISFFMMSIYYLLLKKIFFMEYYLFSLNSSEIYMTFLFDWMSLLFMSFVLFISSMVIKYSEEYMEGDLNMNRFIMLIMLFVLSMMIMIISPNLVSILLGWDGLGLISYCLVIYYQNIKSYNAGMLTALSNRVGDVALLMSIAWMMNYGSWSFFFYNLFNDKYMFIITSFIVLAAMTKSAQIPFSAWLPAAMAAPTPVSSLVHSSTLVTAGVYLLIRFNLMLNSTLLMILLMLSSFTMLMSGIGANYEFDLKKIIALSTLSQLGLMMSILCLGGFNLAFFHLLSHALFKALLFMCAGNMIHNLMNYQDIRFMGSMVNFMPLTCSFFFISNLSLCGFPFLAGFYSKDLILEFMSMNYMNNFIFINFFFCTGLTSSYTIRLIYYLMFKYMNFMPLNLIKDSSKKMLISMMMLFYLVIIGGSILNWLIFDLPIFICLPYFMKLFALTITLMGVILGILISLYKLNNMKLKFMKMNSILGNMWNLPYIFTMGVNFYPLSLSFMMYKLFDQGWLENFGGQYYYKNLKNLSLFYQLMYFNNLKIYLMLMILWIMFLIMI
uniref:NADH-ubiquinone oxidoreductase chain 5 n=1 Tax=Leiodidae sp. BMNH 1274323 TaxID=1796520 RepID=A0A126TFC4_9COLE|nr:NADH dehydrogenase subunit 5 [Leiodidae sp. BMNH 1274323]